MSENYKTEHTEYISFITRWFITARQRSCGKIMFSVVSVCQSFCPGGWVLCDHYPWCIGPHHTGNLPSPALMYSPLPHSTGHIQTCTTWTSLYRNPPPDIFKLIQLGLLCTAIQPCSKLFNIKHLRSASGWLAFCWNAFYFWVVSIPSMNRIVAIEEAADNTNKNLSFKF